MKKSIVILISLIMALSMFLAVSAQRTDLNVITQVSPNSLDPQKTSMLYALQVAYNIYDGLMARDTSDQVVPGLAESYTISEDGLVYDFVLRQGVKFHDGTDFTAEDVVFTINRAIELAITNSGNIESAEAVNDYEVKITLKKPNSVFLSILSSYGFFMLPKEAVEAAGEEFGRNPVGTGAYKFVEWVEGEYVKLEAFEDYYLGAPEIKEVTFKFIGDSNTALIAMESGDADYSYVFPASASEDIEFNEDLKLFPFNSMSLQIFTMNVQNQYLSNKLVRQAINYAVNRDDMVIVAVEGEGRPTSQFCNVGTFGYVEGFEGYTYDLEKAKALMAEAGYADGFTVKLIAQDEMTSKMCQVLADNLRDININVEIEMQESNTAIANYQAGNFEMGVFGIGNSTMDYDSMGRLFTPGNSLMFSQATAEDEQAVKIGELFAEASQLSDPDARLEVYKAATEEIWDAAYYVPCFFPLRSHLLASDLDIECVRGLGVALVKEMHWN